MKKPNFNARKSPAQALGQFEKLHSRYWQYQVQDGSL